MKNWLFLIYITSMLLILAACENNESSAAKKGEEPITLKLSFNLDDNSSHGQASHLFKERVEELSEGEIKVELFPNQQLGDMRAQIEQVQSGAIEMTLQGTSTLSNFSEPLGLVELPFLFPDDEIMWEVLSGEAGQEIFSELEEVNMVGLSYFSQGFRQMTANKPIRSPEDLKGIKFRTMPSPLLIDTMENLGANAVTLDLGELYNGLQQGIIDAEDNNLETIRQLSLNEVQTDLTISNHNFLAFAYVVNKEWYDELSLDLQKIVSEAAEEAGEFSVDYFIETEKEELDFLEERMEVTELTEEEIEIFREASEEVYRKYASDENSSELIDKLEKAVENATSN